MTGLIYKSESFWSLRGGGCLFLLLWCLRPCPLIFRLCPITVLGCLFQSAVLLFPFARISTFLPSNTSSLQRLNNLSNNHSWISLLWPLYSTLLKLCYLVPFVQQSALWVYFIFVTTIIGLLNCSAGADFVQFPPFSLLISFFLVVNFQTFDLAALKIAQLPFTVSFAFLLVGFLLLWPSSTVQYFCFMLFVFFSYPLLCSCVLRCPGHTGFVWVFF